MTDPEPVIDGPEVCWIDPAYDAPDPLDAGPTIRTSAVFTDERAKLEAQGLKMLRREQWGASRSYTDPRTVITPARRFFLHVAVIGSSPSFTSRLRLIESIGISRFPATGASYNAAVDFDGTLAELQPLSRRGAHTVVEYAPNKMGLPDGHNANYDSRALVLPQNCPDRVTDQQIDSAARWGAAQIRAGLAVQGAQWYGHRDAAAKSCPCDTGYRRIPELQRLTDHYAANGLQPEDWFTMATEADLRNALRTELANYRDETRADVIAAIGTAVEWHSAGVKRRAEELGWSDVSLRRAVEYLLGTVVLDANASSGALAAKLDALIAELAVVKALVTPPEPESLA